MTFVELAAINARVEELNKRNSRPGLVRLRDVSDVIAGPATLEAALEAEAAETGHVEWRDGRPCWVAGPARFRP